MVPLVLSIDSVVVSQILFIFLQAEDGIRDLIVTGVQTCALPILGDVKALYQILLQFFTTLVSKFPIDPLGALSIPSLAFKTWRTVQLPLLNKEGFKIYEDRKSVV